MRQAAYRVALIVATGLAIGDHAQSQPPGEQRWFLRTDIQGLVGQYSGSTARDSLANLGAFVHADYFERGGFTIGYNGTALGFNDGSEDVDQDNLFLSGRIAFTPDALDGRITLRFDVYDTGNNAADVSDSVSAGAARVSYLSFGERFYWDVGFTRSDYGRDTTSGEPVELDQLTPTLGFALNQQRDWLQLRAYLIRPSHPIGQSMQDSTSAIELKWTHWLPPNGFLGLESLRFSALGGERLFAVDQDAATIYNLSELQTRGLSFGGEWDIGERSSVMVIAGVENYENPDLASRYRSPYLYLNFSREWN